MWCVHPCSQPAHLDILCIEGRIMESFKEIFILSWNPVAFDSFLPFGTHGRCFDRGLGKRQRPDVFPGRERSFLRSGSFLRLSDHEIVWCTMRTRKCFIIALFDFASYFLGLYFIINSTISSIFFWRTFPPVSFIIFSFDQHSTGLEVLQAESAALLRTKKSLFGVGDSCSYYPRFKAVFRTIS